MSSQKGQWCFPFCEEELNKADLCTNTEARVQTLLQNSSSTLRACTFVNLTATFLFFLFFDPRINNASENKKEIFFCRAINQIKF